MAVRDLYRWAGVAGLLSGLFLVIRGVTVPLGGSAAIAVVLILAWITALYAVTGVYLIQRRESGTLGAVGYAVNLLGLALVITRASAASFVFRRLPADTLQPLMRGGVGPLFHAAGLVLLIGVLLLGLATLRAGVLPRGAAVLYMVGIAGFVLGTFALGRPVLTVVGGGAVLAGIGMAWFGYALWSSDTAGAASVPA